jgi:2-polyprenyl-6-methoxyphenol hydroxylase-like FAD-dependent oxidoreductase
LLLERQRDFAREFRGEVVLPSGREVLNQLGLDDELSRVAQRAPTHFQARFEGRVLAEGEADPNLLGDLPPLSLSQPQLLEALVSAGARHPTYAFERGASVSDLIEEGGRIVGVRYRRDAQECEVRADLVIGCDGRSSIVRRAGNFEVRSDRVPMDVVWCKFSPMASDLGRALGRFYVSPGHLFISYYAPDGMLQVAWVIFKGSFGDIRRRGVEEWIDELANHVEPELAGHLRTRAASAEHPFLVSTVSDHVTHWRKPGVLLLGDAAHTMSPVGGQGINVALQDVVSAANHLIPVLGKGAGWVELDAACRGIEKQRRPLVSQVQRLQAFPPRVIFGDAWWMRSIRYIAPRLLGLAPIQRFVLRRAGPFLRRSSELRLEV